MAMTDHDALVALNHAYGDAVRLGVVDGADAWAATWTDDGVWVLPGRHVEGREAILAAWRTALGKYHRVIQLYLAPAFDVQGDRASGRVPLVELVDEGDGRRSMMAGHYDDGYRRTGLGWKFASRVLTITYRGPADLSGLFFDP
ncbi:MAG: nuclear transport factor 2 family protein [Ilumatobacteraceae bacterium]|nr:nuclear transport factor 2 family protein [Ilumatobacter sp.]MCO5331025.1 nuclear transport factor 2 family protein [Ilumatobacteraceae bacterium]